MICQLRTQVPKNPFGRVWGLWWSQNCHQACWCRRRRWSYNFQDCSHHLQWVSGKLRASANLVLTLPWKSLWVWFLLVSSQLPLKHPDMQQRHLLISSKKWTKKPAEVELFYPSVHMLLSILSPFLICSCYYCIWKMQCNVCALVC